MPRPVDSRAATLGRGLLIGTAGHVDHGKTALVRALTGIDTDRLPEEKRRGITLELGFAHLTLPGGSVAGVVDVPGHERFVKAMVAGAGGVDVALLAIAADEGVMPQTREHVDICQLLGIRAGVVAITKSDLLPELGEEWHGLLRADVEALTAGTFLEGAPWVEVSSRSGEGLAELRAALAAAAAAAPARPVSGPAFLPIDRAFTLKGFGTIVTGTLLSGALAADQPVDLLPGGPSGVRLRGLQRFGEEAARVEAGQRTAANLMGVDVDQLRRGLVLGREGELAATPMLDVLLENPRSGAALSATAKLLCHLGTDVVPCTAVLLEKDRLAPGETGFGQLRLARPIPALPGQRFILRGFAAARGRGRTVAGGAIVAILPKRRRPARPGAAEGLELLSGGDAVAKIEWLLEDAGPRGLDERELFLRTALPKAEIARALSALGSRDQAVLADRERRLFVGGRVFERLVGRAAELVLDHHRENPLAPGIPKEELRGRLASPLDAPLFGKLLAALAEAGRAVAEGDVVRSPSHERDVRETDTGPRDRILSKLAAGGLSPPGIPELASACDQPPERVAALLKLLAGEGRAVRVKDDLYFAAEAIEALRARLRAHLLTKGEITTPEFKEMTGATRKFTIPLGEYFDREKLTLRLGDKRVLRGAPAEGRGEGAAG
ncbi:MAG: selenocysteine-specific translation elongation factor [Myxococcales bacterium]